jgi:hypothetical protein
MAQGDLVSKDDARALNARRVLDEAQRHGWRIRAGKYNDRVFVAERPSREGPRYVYGSDETELAATLMQRF